MKKIEYCVVGLDGKEDEPIDPRDQGNFINITVALGYPGSRVSDIFIGDHKVQVPNSALRAAHDLHENDTEGG